MRKMFSENQIKKLAEEYNPEEIEIEFTENGVRTIKFEEGKLYHIKLSEAVTSAKLMSDQIVSLVISSNATTPAEFSGVPYSEKYITFDYENGSNQYFAFIKGIIFMTTLEI